MTTDFTMFAGNSKDIQVTVKDPDGQLVDIWDSTIVWRLAPLDWKSANSPTVILLKEVDAGITISDTFTGQFTVHLNPDDTDTLAGKYYHEAEVTLPDGTVATVITGKVKIVKDINADITGS